MNERVKELRKALGLSGEKFGEPLGVQRNSISQIETGKNNLTDQMIKLICLTYNVNEDWLRTGQGSMFNETDDGFLSELKREFNLSDFDMKFLEAYMSLDKEDRASIKKLITSCCENPNDEEI